MAIDFSIHTQAAQTAAMTSGAAAGAAQTGSLLGGCAVMVASPMSLLADAAEELTFSVDTTDEFELDERKEKDKTDKALAERVQLYKDLMHEAGQSRELDMLKDSLRSKAGREGALREATRHFPDPSDAWVALADALEELEKDTSVAPEVLEEIRAAMDELDASHGAAIRTGMQGALHAAGYSDLGTMDDLRDLYRQTVCDFTNVSAVFEHIHANYGDIGFDRAVDFLVGTLSADLALDVPSMELKHLENVYGSLGQVRLLQSAYTQCDKVLDRWEHVHNVSVRDSSLSSMDFLGELVKLREEKFLGAMHIEQLAARFKAPDMEREVLCLQELLTMTRNLPSQLFDGDQGRMKVIDAVQDAVDKAVAREDEFLASQV